MDDPFLDVCDERKNKAKNQMVLVLREENVLLKNMTSYYQERECLDENQNSKHMEVSLGLEIAQDLVPNHLSMMRRLARKFNDKTTSDFIVKSQVCFRKSLMQWVEIFSLIYLAIIVCLCGVANLH